MDGAMPCAVLITGVERSIANLTSKQSDRFYDHETLRELCGCLIHVTQEGSILNSIIAGTYHMEPELQHEVLTVRFAHYTVHEYLSSNRISKTSPSYVTGCKEDLEQNIMEMMFAESLQVEQKKPYCDFPQDNPCDVVEAGEGYFTAYCAISSLCALHRCPARISRHDKLSKLAILLLDPSKAHFNSLKSTALVARRFGVTFLSDLEDQFWDLIWDSEAYNTDAAHLLNFLLLAREKPECLSLAEKCLQSKDNKDFLTTRLIFTHSFEGFDGSILEIFAERAFEVPGRLRLLLEHGTGLFDPSVILLLFIRCHQCHPNDDCSSYCLLKRLLELGADANVNECWVTPLQIAVYCRDFIATRILLEAGANPNPVEQSSGNAWERLTLLCHFNQLTGYSPLYIYRHPGYFEGDDVCYDEETGKRQGDPALIEAILLKYGAESFCDDEN